MERIGSGNKVQVIDTAEAGRLGDAYDATQEHGPKEKSWIEHSVRDDGNDVVVQYTSWSDLYIYRISWYSEGYWYGLVNENGKITVYKSYAGF